MLFCTFSYFPHAAGGAEHQAQLQAEELQRRGNQVTVVCPRWTGTRSDIVNGVRVWRVPFVDRRPFRTISYHLSLVFALLPRLRLFQVAHVHLALFQSEAVMVAGAIGGRQIPVYVKLAAGGPYGDIHRVAPVSRFSRYFGLRRAARVQALSDEIAREAVAVGVRSERVLRIDNGVDTRVFHPVSDGEREQLRCCLGLPERSIVALYAGRFARHKGVQHLIAAWRTLGMPGARLVLVGSTNTMDPMDDLPNDPSIDVRGWTHDVAAFFKAADIFVLPSYVEGMSNALLEAMACGLAVVATRVGAAESLICDGVSGLLIDPGREDQLANALTRLARDPDLRARLGCAARKVAERFSIASVVDRIEREYEEIALPS